MSSTNPKRVLVTGGTGFVGSNLVRRLLRDGHRVALLVRSNHQLWRLRGIETGVQLMTVDFADQPSLRAAVKAAKPDWIFHLAAYGAYSWQTDARKMVSTNILGTMSLLEACLAEGFEAFVNAGSSSEYGFKDHAPSEDEYADPNSDYSWTKCAATHYLRHTARVASAHIVTMRLYSIYGPWEDANRLIPKLILRGLEGKFPPLAGPGVARDYVYTEDANDGMILAASIPAKEPGAVYNLGTGIQTSLREAAETARSIFGIAAEPSFGSMANRNWDATIWVADRSRITEDLGWQPRHSFAQGLKVMADWFRAEPGIIDFYRQLEQQPKAGDPS